VHTDVSPGRVAIESDDGVVLEEMPIDVARAFFAAVFQTVTVFAGAFPASDM
jgi:hypothetical protein